MSVRMNINQQDFLVKWCYELHTGVRRLKKMREEAPSNGYRGDKLRELLGLMARETLLTEVIFDQLIIARTNKYRPQYERLTAVAPGEVTWFGVRTNGLQTQDVQAFAREIALIEQGRLRLQPGEYQPLIDSIIDGYAEDDGTQEELHEIRRELVLKGYKELFDPVADKEWYDEKVAEAKQFYDEIARILPPEMLADS